MARSRVLLVGDRDASLRELSAALERESDGDVAAEVVARIGDALQRVSGKGYDAVVCWSERLDELTGVLRIRKANPELPIVAVTPQDDPGFQALARQMGATRILGMGASVSSISEMLRLALSTGDLARELRVQAEGVRSRAEK